MSNKQNDEFIESMTERYHEALGNKEWWKMDELGVEMAEVGFPELETVLSMSMTKEEIAEYRAWDERANGSIATQMDENLETN